MSRNDLLFALACSLAAAAIANEPRQNSASARQLVASLFASASTDPGIDPPMFESSLGQE